MNIEVIYHLEEEGSWWAESPDLAGFTAAADNLDDLRQLVLEAAEEILGKVPAVGETFETVGVNVSANAFSVQIQIKAHDSTQLWSAHGDERAGLAGTWHRTAKQAV